MISRIFLTWCRRLGASALFGLEDTLRDVLVVSRNAAIAAALTADDLNVMPVDPDETPGWAEFAAAVHLLVLELGDADHMVDVVRDLRRADVTVSVLIIAESVSDRPRLIALRLADDDVKTLSLPLTQNRLMRAVSRALVAREAADARAEEAYHALPATEDPDESWMPSVGVDWGTGRDAVAEPILPINPAAPPARRAPEQAPAEAVAVEAGAVEAVAPAAEPDPARDDTPDPLTDPNWAAPAPDDWMAAYTWQNVAAETGADAWAPEMPSWTPAAQQSAAAPATQPAPTAEPDTEPDAEAAAAGPTATGPTRPEPAAAEPANAPPAAAEPTDTDTDTGTGTGTDAVEPATDPPPAAAVTEAIAASFEVDFSPAPVSWPSFELDSFTESDRLDPHEAFSKDALDAVDPTRPAAAAPSAAATAPPAPVRPPDPVQPPPARREIPPAAPLADYPPYPGTAGTSPQPLAPAARQDVPPVAPPRPPEPMFDLPPAPDTEVRKRRLAPWARPRQRQSPPTAIAQSAPPQMAPPRGAPPSAAPPQGGAESPGSVSSPAPAPAPGRTGEQAPAAPAAPASRAERKAEAKARAEAEKARAAAVRMAAKVARDRAEAEAKAATRAAKDAQARAEAQARAAAATTEHRPDPGAGRVPPAQRDAGPIVAPWGTQAGPPPQPQPQPRPPKPDAAADRVRRETERAALDAAKAERAALEQEERRRQKTAAEAEKAARAQAEAQARLAERAAADVAKAAKVRADAEARAAAEAARVAAAEAKLRAKVDVDASRAAQRAEAETAKAAQAKAVADTRAAAEATRAVTKARAEAARIAEAQARDDERAAKAKAANDAKSAQEAARAAERAAAEAARAQERARIVAERAAHAQAKVDARLATEAAKAAKVKAEMEAHQAAVRAREDAGRARIEFRLAAEEARKDTITRVESLIQETKIKAEADRIVNEAVRNAEADFAARKQANRPVFYGPELEPPGIGYLHQLMAMTDTLAAPAQVAEELAFIAMEHLECDAVAIMIPDGDAWATASGIGIGRADIRYRLTEEHWFVREVLGRETVALLDDPKKLTEELSGVPLADRPFLVGLPMPRANSILVAARSDAPFESDVMEVFAEGIEDYVTELAETLETRDVAREIHDRRRRR